MILDMFSAIDEREVDTEPMIEYAMAAKPVLELTDDEAEVMIDDIIDEQTNHPYDCEYKCM